MAGSGDSISSGAIALDPELGRYSWRLMVSYDGTEYAGWQLQPAARTVQGEFERALSTALQEGRRTLCICAAGGWCGCVVGKLLSLCNSVLFNSVSFTAPSSSRPCIGRPRSVCCTRLALLPYNAHCATLLFPLVAVLPLPLPDPEQLNTTAGRTDAGVHAKGQVVQFFTNATALDPASLPRKLNSLLPPDVRVRYAAQTAPDFSVTVSAVRKVGVYIHSLEHMFQSMHVAGF